MYDYTNPDWVPSLKLGYGSSTSEVLVAAADDRYRRQCVRSKRKEFHADVNPAIKARLHKLKDPCSCSVQTTPTTVDASVQSEVAVIESANQTDLSLTDLSRQEEQICQLQAEISQQKDEINSLKLSEESFRNEDDKVKYYTGLPSFAVLLTLFQFLQPFLPKTRTVLTHFQQYILVLQKLRLNLTMMDLAYRFNVSKATVSRTFADMIEIMHARMQPMVKWPEREELRKTMPMEFKAAFGGCVSIIIDCFEIFTDRPSNLLARAQTWSSYKHRNTAKFLIGCCPQGAISFISKGWGGRVSDKHLTENCGLLGKLLPGDIILADRGFDIQESVGVMCAEVKIPAFTRGKSQLSALDVERTRKLAHLRIHIERVIGAVRQKYTILQGPVPVHHLMSKNSENTCTIDKIVFICCALTNLCESVVPFQ